MATVQEFRISDILWGRLSPHLPVHVPTHTLGLPSAAEAARQVYLIGGPMQDLCLDASDDYAQVHEVVALGYIASIHLQSEEV